MAVGVQRPQGVDGAAPCDHHGESVDTGDIVEPLAHVPELEHGILHNVVSVHTVADDTESLRPQARSKTAG